MTMQENFRSLAVKCRMQIRVARVVFVNQSVHPPSTFTALCSSSRRVHRPSEPSGPVSPPMITPRFFVRSM